MSDIERKSVMPKVPPTRDTGEGASTRPLAPPPSSTIKPPPKPSR
jgi:hypothetical protein